MKLILVICTIMVVVRSEFYVPPALVNGTCNPGLLATYNLEWVKKPVNDTNYICNGIVNNCCTINSQLTIYSKWFRGNLRKKMMHLYKTSIATFSLIFDHFKVIEEMADIVKNNIPPKEISNCSEMSKAILQARASQLKESVLSALKKSYRYIYDSRRGFYCSLCDADAHPNYNTQDGAIHFSYGFCSDLVKNTMNWSIFKFKHFHKLSRLYGQFLFSCSTSGKYDQTKVLPDNLKFYKEDKYIKQIDTCMANTNLDSSINECYEYCSNFNPVKFSRMFEGQFSRLLSFRVAIEKEVTAKIYASMKGFSKDDLSFSGRILQSKKNKNKKKGNSTKTVKPKGLWDSKYSEFNEFNSKYNVQMINPTSYKFENDNHMTRLFNYRSSIFPLGPHKIYDLAKFTGIMSTNGINHLKYGYQLIFDDTKLLQLDMDLKNQTSRLIRNATDPMSPNYGYNTRKINFKRDA